MTSTLLDTRFLLPVQRQFVMHSVSGKMSGKVVAKSADVTVVVIALNGRNALSRESFEPQP